MGSLVRSFAALLCAATLAGCHTGGTSTFVGASTMTALAMGSAVAERAAGGCIAMCTNGTVCNPQNGLCEVLPCRNQCQATEHCEQTFSGEKCVAGGPTSVETLVKGKTPVVPAFLPATAPPQNGSPTIVPTAEQAAPR